ncbi:MAG TPA: YARHG domain-containing protein [Rhizobiales bacterium]|nr:YARHG domain-containing protein [Hyphomicrobiales bacterium]
MPSHRFRAVRLLAIVSLAIAEPSAAFAAARNALVIGNSSYRPGYELRNPVADARAVAKSLSQLGFSVTLVEDSDLATAQRALDAFVPAATAGDAAVIYYAGHGAMIEGRSFLLPVDFSMASFDAVDREALDAERLMQALSSTHSSFKLLIFDACRNNPLETRGAAPLQRGSDAPPPRTENMLIAFSTTQGATALDGTGEHSPFAEGLIRHIGETGTDVDLLMKKVSSFVRDKTEGRQTVWIEGSMTRPFYLAAPASAAGAVTTIEPPRPAEAVELVFADSDTVLLTADRLAGLDAATLRLARNEIFARRGGRFADPALTAHFERFSWYRPTTFEPVLGAIEQKNVETIRRYELAASAPQDGFIFADSDRRLLTAEEVGALDKGQLAFARNEIYARRGRKFVKAEFRDYFSRFAWYKPQFGEVELTYVEQKNVDLIRKFEK